MFWYTNLFSKTMSKDRRVLTILGNLGDLSGFRISSDCATRCDNNNIHSVFWFMRIHACNQPAPVFRRAHTDASPVQHFSRESGSRRA